MKIKSPKEYTILTIAFKMTNQQECQICCNNLTKNSIFHSSCCTDKYICKTCVEKNSCSSIEKPSCIFCKKIYPDSLIEESLTKASQNRIHKHQSQIFCESQMALLPATQPYAERELSIITLKNELNNVIDKEKKLKNQLLELATDKRRILSRLYRLELINHAREVPPELRAEEVDGVGWRVPCSWDGCNGFVSKGYKCGLCSRFTCSSCQMPKDNDHTCKQADVDSVMLIKKDTKACPACSTRIFKISGCSQMFCVKPGCNTIFDWNTLKIQKNGFVHNPHALDFRRNNMGGNCGGAEFNIHNLDRYFFTRERNPQPKSYPANQPNTYEYRIRNRDKYNILRSIDQQIAHVEHILQVLQNNTIDIDLKFRVLRVQFLLNKINKTEWITKINTLRKKQTRDHMYQGIIDIIPDTLRGLLHEQGQNIKSFKDLDTSQIREFGILVNDELKKLNTKYKIVGYTLQELLI